MKKMQGPNLKNAVQHLRKAKAKELKDNGFEYATVEAIEGALMRQPGYEALERLPTDRFIARLRCPVAMVDVTGALSPVVPANVEVEIEFKLHFGEEVMPHFLITAFGYGSVVFGADGFFEDMEAVDPVIQKNFCDASPFIPSLTGDEHDRLREHYFGPY
jgi:hypothetical protein